MRYSLSWTEKNLIGEVVTKQTQCLLKFTNASGSYSLSVNSNSVLPLNQSSILSGKGTMDGNLIGPATHCDFSIIPALDGKSAKLTITLPDGTVIDPGMYQIMDYWNGIFHWTGWMFWWEPGTQGVVNFIMVGLAMIAIASIYLAALVIVMGTFYAEAYLYTASSGNTYVFVIIESMPVLWWNVAFFCIAGFYTDHTVMQGQLFHGRTLICGHKEYRYNIYGKPLRITKMFHSILLLFFIRCKPNLFCFFIL